MLMPPQQQNPYEFIMSSPQQQKSGPNLSSTKARIAVVVIGIILLIIIGVIANKILTASSSAQTDKLIVVAQTETELIRVASLGLENAQARETLNQAATIKASVQSSQNQTKALLDKRGIKGKSLTTKLSASKNSKTDAQLEEARRNNRYDETFTAIIDQQLNNYLKTLQSAHGGASKKEKAQLEKSAKNVGNLLPKTDEATE
jgi:hypothetical protein